MKIFDYKASLAGTNDVGNEAQIIYVVPYDSCLSGGGFLAAEFEFGAYFGQSFTAPSPFAETVALNTPWRDSLTVIAISSCDSAST